VAQNDVSFIKIPFLFLNLDFFRSHSGADPHFSTKSQKAQWDRLDTLNKKRSSLEALILASMRSIEQHSANISNEMAAMFGGRIEDIQETALQHGKEMVRFHSTSLSTRLCQSVMVIEAVQRHASPPLTFIATHIAELYKTCAQ
jgi:hypothetical protein